MQASYENQGIRTVPPYWGRWFCSITDSAMKSTNLNIFYQMGSALGYLVNNCRTGQKIAELSLYVMMPRQWLIAFLEETKPIARYLPDSRACAEKLVDRLTGIMAHGRIISGVAVTEYECSEIFSGKDQFDNALDREHRNLAVFTVTPKGTRDTSLLIENPEMDFTKAHIAVLPAQFILDLKQAARCLAFDLPTACAFHACRATESLMIAYYELLAGHEWTFSKRDWKIYIEQLANEKAPKKITTRLDEIRDMDRNSYAHPETNVSLDEAPLLYGLCSAVNYYMADEMVKLTS